MIDLKCKVEKNKIYNNCWSVFSKLLLAKDLLNSEKNYLIIVENEKVLNNYLKISNFLWIKLDNFDNISDFINIGFNKIWKYIVTKDFFNLVSEDKEQFEYKNTFKLDKWQTIEIPELTQKLNSLGIKFNDHQNPYTFSINWDTLNYTDKSWQLIKISFWDNEVDDIFIWDTLVDNYVFWRNQNIISLEYSKNINEFIIDVIWNTDAFILLDWLDYYSHFDKILVNTTNYLGFSALWIWKENINLWFNDLIINNVDDFKAILDDKKINKFIITKNIKTINNFVDLNNITWVKVIESKLNNLKSFRTESDIFIWDDNISRIFIKKRVKRTLSENLDLLMQIKPWDYIVHIDHGVWKFKEIIEKELAWVKKEYITLEYKNSDKLFVPITEVSRVSKYVWVENPKLTWLSTKDWEKKLKKVSEDVEQIAGELLEIYAKRKLQTWHSFLSKKDEESNFFNSFEYVYTEDQFNVINEIYTDMEWENPMDRLLSWDVWFWKTEVAFASIFKAMINNKQAALISPLVVLAYEHYENAKERFKDFPFNIEVITRFEKASVIKTTLKKLKEWKIDLIVWTHRLLSEDIEFRDLGLLVIDEEHKFWVKDKEKIKRFKWNIDILSMSATPIPRSLNMALNGIKQVSMLTTPPVWKQAIQTIVSSFEDDLIFDACKREFERWGQIFFIHNRVETITWMKTYLENLFPWKKVVVAHWQLPWDKLEQRILEFKRKQHDILLATTVVENGIDFSNVNTIFINDAVNFWISQIHQLRWRVWRWLNKGFCYLLFKKDKIKEDAAKRLKTIVDYSHLWAWFELAVKDLEIRWWWDILGIRQSWSSVDIWVSLFIEMLENKIEELKVERSLSSENESSLKRIKTTIDLNIDAFIPEEFFSSDLDKINFYREIESIRELDDLNNLISDFKNINENIPKSTENLFNLIKIKILSSKYKINSIRKVWINYQIDFDENISLENLKEFLLLDKEVKFAVVNWFRLRSSTKNFISEQKFIEYLLLIFEKKIKPKIKLKRK